MTRRHVYALAGVYTCFATAYACLSPHIEAALTALSATINR